MTKYQRLLTNDYQISTKDYVRIYKLFMQNKANFPHFSPKNVDFTKKQTQFKANLTQNKPNLTQFKAKTNPIKAGAYERRETQITFDLAVGISIKSYVTQKSSVATEIMRKG